MFSSTYRVIICSPGKFYCRSGKGTIKMTSSDCLLILCVMFEVMEGGLSFMISMIVGKIMLEKCIKICDVCCIGCYK